MSLLAVGPFPANVKQIQRRLLTKRSLCTFSTVDRKDPIAKRELVSTASPHTRIRIGDRRLNRGEESGTETVNAHVVRGCGECILPDRAIFNLRPMTGSCDKSVSIVFVHLRQFA
jgi:hypothetical protein